MRIPRVVGNRQLMVLCVVAAAAYAGAGMVSTVRILYVHSHGGSLAVISAMTSAFLIANFAFQYPWGWLADRWGRKPVILAGLATQSVFTAAYLFINAPELFIGLRFLEGAATASILPAARAAISDLVPDDERGQAYGIFSAFFNIGFLFGPAAGGFLAAVSFKWVFLLSVILYLVSVVLIWRAFAATRPVPEESRQRWSVNLAAVFTVPLLGGYLLAFGDYLWVGFDLTLAPLWMREHLGATVAMIGLTYSIWALPSAITAPFGGRVADRFPRSVLVLIFGLLQVPIYVVYGEARTMLPVMVFFAIHACIYAIVSPAVDAHVARHSPPQQSGTVQSIYTAIGVVGAFVGASLFVPLYAVNFRLPLFVMGAAYGIFILLGSSMMFLSDKRTRQFVLSEA